MCTYAARALNAFSKKYPEVEIYDGEPFYNSRLDLWVIEIPGKADLDRFNKFVKREYASEDNRYTEIDSTKC